jgi:hypothetical protein
MFGMNVISLSRNRKPPAMATLIGKLDDGTSSSSSQLAILAKTTLTPSQKDWFENRERSTIDQLNSLPSSCVPFNCSHFRPSTMATSTVLLSADCSACSHVHHKGWNVSIGRLLRRT